jgi:hypothetical protein
LRCVSSPPHLTAAVGAAVAAAVAASVVRCCEGPPCAVSIAGEAQLRVLIEPVPLEAGWMGGGELAEGAGVRYALVFAQHVLPQLGGITRLVRTGGALVTHLVVTLQAKRKNKMTVKT